MAIVRWSRFLTTVLTDGLAVVEAACQAALDDGVHAADVILNILARQREVVQPLTIILRSGWLAASAGQGPDRARSKIR